MKDKLYWGHQGDVPLQKIKVGKEIDVSNLHKSIEKFEDTPYLLLTAGEKPKHCHMIDQASATVYELGEFENIKRKLVVVHEPTSLIHFNVQTKKMTTEHGDIPTLPGQYIFGNQRSVNHKNEIERLLD